MAMDLLAAGMVTPVGFSASSSCAAMRVRLDGFRETRFMFDGDWVLGGLVPFPRGVVGREKLLQMASLAVDECLAGSYQGTAGDTALMVCLPESERPGRLARLDESFGTELLQRLAASERISQAHFGVLQAGRMGPVTALQWTEQVLRERVVRYGLILGVDSLLTAQTLASYHAGRRLMTLRNPDGLIPGEAAAALLLGASARSGASLRYLGAGTGLEPALMDSDRPLRADGLTQAYQAAFAASSCGYEAVDYRITDISGEQYGFKEAALALARTMRVQKDEFDLWQPANSVGDVGAAFLPLALGVAMAAWHKAYAPGPGVLIHCGDSTGARAAVVLRG